MKLADGSPMDRPVNQDPALLANVTRGPISESRHWGHVVVLDPDGKEVARAGSPDTIIHFRSSAKPFQAIPLVETGAADAYGFGAREIAIACGSHAGEDVHVSTVTGMLERLGLTAADLACGEQMPYGNEARRKLLADGGTGTQLHNNCSGKHSGMLAVALRLGAPTAGYENQEHPVQQRIRTTLAQLLNQEPGELVTGIDGCSVPSFAGTLRSLALLFTRLAVPEMAPSGLQEPLQRIRDAMMGNPVMVSGSEAGRSLDTHLMEFLPGRIVSKLGAEGVYAAAILPNDRWPRGLGVAIKFEDGDTTSRARGPVVIELLRRLKVIGTELPHKLQPYDRPPVTNRRGIEVGQVLPHLELLID